MKKQKGNLAERDLMHQGHQTQFARKLFSQARCVEQELYCFICTLLKRCVSLEAFVVAGLFLLSSERSANKLFNKNRSWRYVRDRRHGAERSKSRKRRSATLRHSETHSWYGNDGICSIRRTMYISQRRTREASIFRIVVHLRFVSTNLPVA